MKKIIFSLCLVFLSVMGFSQEGLDGIIVEKYYVANAADHAKDNTLPVGAVTYRIYVDMKPGWILQAINGSPSFNQRLQFKTTTSFFNETISGDADAFGQNIKYTSLKNGLLMLDSWISMGAAAKTAGASIYYGVPKADDDAANQIVNTDPTVLQNTSGYPAPFVKDRDGIRTVAAPPLPAIGQSPTLTPLVTMLNGGTANDFTTTDATWFTSDNCTGPDPATNKVLIGQFTTEGIFTFRINLQIKNPTTTVVEKYVNENPGTGQFLRSDLAQTLGMPNTPPVVSITAPVAPVPTIIAPDAVTFTAHATDAAPGSVTDVEFFLGGISIGHGTKSGDDYTFVWTSAATSGAKDVTAIATDDEGAVTTSLPVSITANNNQAPVVNSLTVPSSVNVGASFSGSATATDPEGALASIEFFVNGASVGVVPSPGPYTFTATAPPTEQILTVKAVAKDARNALSAEKTAPVTVTDPAGGYKILSQTVSCNSSDFFYVPVATKGAGIANVIGFDLVMKFDAANVRPTGRISVNSDLISDPTLTAYNIRVASDSMFISLYFNSNAPAGTFFHGTGEVLRAEFTKLPGTFAPNQVVIFTVPSFIESYTTGVSLNKPVDSGNYETFAEKNFYGYLKFWADQSPIYYTEPDPITLVPTSLLTTIWSCDMVTPYVKPDANGRFTWDITKGLHISIVRDIYGGFDPNVGTDVQPVVNGYDAYLMQKVLVDDPSFLPNIYQIIAMDVNLDGKVSAGDMSQLNQRTVLKIGEYRQAFNYNNDGTKKSTYTPSQDWLFVDNTTLVSDEAFRKSKKWPLDDGKGYSKNRVPNNNVCRALPVTYPVPGYACPDIRTEEYQGIMLGDADGSYKNIAQLSNPGIKGSMSEEKADVKEATSKSSSAESKVVFDLSKATLNDGYITFPISVSSESDVNALDFSMKFDLSKLSFKSVFNHSNNLQSLAYYNDADQTLRVTSFSLQNYPKDAAIVSLRFELKNDKLSNDDLNSIKAYINGNQAEVELSKLILNDEIEGKVKIYPNPARTVINVELSENADIDFADINGKIIRTIKDVNAYQKHEINVEGMPQGMYFMKIYMKIGNDLVLTTKKVVIKK